MFDVALSTMWAIGQFQSLADFFVAGEGLGYTGFELNHEVDSAMLNGLPLSSYRITSIHEPCPADISTAELKARDWLISSLEEESRQQGVRAIQRSINLAQELGVSVIVVHPGKVDIDRQLEPAVWSLFETGQAGTPAYQEAKERLIDGRAAAADAHLDAVRRSLVELADYAGRTGVRLGLENRYYYQDIPLLDEMGMLLELTNDERIGFWYDVGHAQALENLGLVAHEVWLKRYAPRMLGVHLHDLKGLKDHFAAGLGEIDWDMVAANLPEDAIRVCEFRSFNQPAQVAAAMQFLADKGCVALS